MKSFGMNPERVCLITSTSLSESAPGSLLLTLPNRKSVPRVFLRSELGRPRPPRAGKAELELLTLELVDAQHCYILAGNRRPGVDALRFLPGVERETALADGLPVAGNGVFLTF